MGEDGNFRLVRLTEENSPWIDYEAPPSPAPKSFPRMCQSPVRHVPLDITSSR